MRLEEEIYWIWLAEACGAGKRLGNLLLDVYGDAMQVYKADPAKLEKYADKWTKRDVESAKQILSQKDLKNAERIYQTCREKGISILPCASVSFPDCLRSITAAPILLYYKGTLPLVDKRLTVAVVGTRTMTDYGREMAYTMGYGLAAGGAIVVSGMALGIDSMAMIGALDAGGVTVAVLGSGVDVIYPREHTKVYERILARGGCILSEYAPGTEPAGRHFPVRNRIISGLADAGVVVEGNAQSGSLITARHIVYQGRKLFAVPGQVGSSGAEGPNDLIRDGALPAIEPEDILREFAYMFPNSVHVNVAHRARWNLDMRALSAAAMEQAQVGARGRPNYIGKGTFGGRREDTEEKVSKHTPQLLKEQYEVPVANPVRPSEKGENTKGNIFTAFGEKSKIKRSEKGKNDAKTKKSKNIDTENIQPAKKIDFNMLDELEIKVYNNMKPNVPMIPDELVTEDITISQVLSAMTVLEMAGAVEGGSGGYYLRIDAEDMPVRLVEDWEITAE